MRILLLEDDIILQEIIEEYLIENGYSVESYHDGEAALEAILDGQYDILLLDINVPQIDGYEILEYLRSITNTTPVIFITSLSSIKNLQKGFELGANDYLKKPFDLDELKVRIEYQIKNTHGEEVTSFGEFEFYPRNQYLKKGDGKIHLKQKEVQILSYMLRKKGSIVSLEELIENVWIGENTPSYATLRTYIKNLRKALGAETITNIKGSGYRLDNI